MEQFNKCHFGLKDKNGIEIYTGSTIHYEGHSGYMLTPFDAKVVYDKESASFGYLRPDSIAPFRPFNIHHELQHDFLNYVTVVK